MNKIPMLETKRLIIRDISLHDANDMFSYAKHPLVGPMAGWKPHTTINETITIINIFIDSKRRGELGVQAIVLKETGQMIGTIELFNYIPGFKAELGYALSYEYWGHGYVPEAAFALLSYAFNNLGLKRVYGNAFKENYQSQRVFLKLGFTTEGVARNGYMRYDGKICDEVVFGLTNEDFFNQKR